MRRKRKEEKSLQREAILVAFGVYVPVAGGVEGEWGREGDWKEQ